MDSKSDEPFNIRKVTEDDAERVLDLSLIHISEPTRH